MFAKRVKLPNRSCQKKKNLKQLYINTKIALLDNYLLCVRVSKWKIFKSSKKIYTSYPQEEIEFHFTFTTLIAFGINNACYLFEKHYQSLKSKFCFIYSQVSGSRSLVTTSSFFTNSSDIFDSLLLSIKTFNTGYFF